MIPSTQVISITQNDAKELAQRIFSAYNTNNSNSLENY